jgi:hypothetical protein
MMSSNNSSAASILFRQLDVNKYMVTFKDTDKHSPDLIVWELKQRPEHQALVSFVETKRNTITENVVDMEIHLRTLCDVADLIQKAALQAADGFGRLDTAFEQAINTF